MVKTFFRKIVLVLFALFFVFAVAACENDGSDGEITIGFKTFTVDGKTAVGKVSNATEIFSFVDELQIDEGVEYILSSVATGETVADTSSVVLEEGTNGFYLYVGEEACYSIVIYRNKSFTVSFDTDGGSSIPSVSVEEGFSVGEPSSVPEKKNHRFDGWDYDFSKAVTGDITVKAKWTLVAYTVGVSFDEKFAQSVSVTGAGEYEKQSDVTVSTALIKSDRLSFKGWYNENEELVCEEKSYTFKVEQNVSLTAVWEIKPIAVCVLLDASGSMGQGPGSALDYALSGVEACVGALSSVDYFGLILIGSEAKVVVPLTRLEKPNEVIETIREIGSGAGGTVFGAAIEAAGQMLSQVDVEKRHVIMMTDGMPADQGQYEKHISVNAQKGISTSVVGIQPSEEVKAKMSEDVKLGGGKMYCATNLADIPACVYSEIHFVLVSLEEEADGE